MSSLYVQVIERKSQTLSSYEQWRVLTSSVPAKAKIFAQINTTGNLVETLSLRETEDNNAHHAILIDDNGFVFDSPGFAFLLYSGDKRLLIPSFDNNKTDPIALRIIELVNQLLSNDTLKNRKEFEWLYDNINSAEFVAPMRPREMLNLSKELFLVGTTRNLVPIYQWDDELVGNQFLHHGSELFRVLSNILGRDMTIPSNDSTVLTRIPYQLVTKH